MSETQRALNGLGPKQPDVTKMSAPVQCRWCARVHDSGPVTVVARYSDCSVWLCPHCKNQVDDRPRSWGGSAFPIDKQTGRVRP